jgi:hypothetical protein
MKRTSNLRLVSSKGGPQALVAAGFFLALAAFSLPAQAQLQISTAPAEVLVPSGAIPIGRGPWVLGEVLFLSGGQPISDFTLQDKVRGSRGVLYAPSDISADVESLMSLGRFLKVEPTLSEIQGSPVPPDFQPIAASTSQVRLVFNLTEKPSQAPTAAPRAPLPNAPISGVALTPTAYRGLGRQTGPGLGLDINGTYVIGRLYGRNSFANAPRSANYIDRIGVWMLAADGKMQLQSEGTLRPAVAVGGQGAFLFRDSPQPKINDPNPSVTINASQKSTRLLSDAYVVASKKLGPVRTSLGFMQGNMGDFVAQFSEFLTPDALSFFAGQRGQTVRSQSVPFASLLLIPKPQYPLAVELMKFNGAARNPLLINFKIGYFLKLNFDLAFLKFDGGYDILGLIQFRYNYFPRN